MKNTQTEEKEPRTQGNTKGASGTSSGGNGSVTKLARKSVTTNEVPANELKANRYMDEAFASLG